ncbi:MAG: MGMT family protein [Cytophagales bacterium]|nr:MGMT family protein [Armatimonadota bacterium]
MNREFALIFDYVRTLPPGRVTSYGEVGAAVGAAARTVGWALGACPDDVPWQRVVGSDGYLRIARRSPHLKALQQQLLESEGVVVSEKGFVERRFFLEEERFRQTDDT